MYSRQIRRSRALHCMESTYIPGTYMQAVHIKSAVDEYLLLDGRVVPEVRLGTECFLHRTPAASSLTLLGPSTSSSQSKTRARARGNALSSSPLAYSSCVSSPSFHGTCWVDAVRAERSGSMSNLQHTTYIRRHVKQRKTCAAKGAGPSVPR